MPTQVACPGCHTNLSIPDDAAGKSLKCPKCRSPFMVPADEPETPAPSEEPAARAEEPEPEERPADRQPRHRGEQRVIVLKLPRIFHVAAWLVTISISAMWLIGFLMAGLWLLAIAIGLSGVASRSHY